MPDLQLITSEQPEDKPKKKVFWGFICWAIMNKVFNEVRQTAPPESQSEALGLLKNWSRTEPTDRNKNWGGAFYDETTGEIIFTPPLPEVWERRYRNYLYDEWSSKNMGSNLRWFLQYYSKWEDLSPVKKRVSVASKPIMYLCPKCKKNVDQTHYCEG